MRLFIAIEIDADIRERIAEYIAQHRSSVHGARWVKTEGMHITLKFLGDVQEARLVNIEHQLESVTGSPFDIHLRALGAFPNVRSPRVLWVGVEAGPLLAPLAAAVDAAMHEVGFPREQRAFAPHVTLARFNPREKPSGIESLLQVAPPHFGTMTAKQFHLYESKLSPKGSDYSKLASFDLQ